jgi:hypothetical protein
MALASEDKSLFNFLSFKGVVDVHLHLAFHEFGFAGSAHTAFAGVRQIRAGP